MSKSVLGALSGAAAATAVGGLVLGIAQLRRRSSLERRVRTAIRHIDPEVAQGVGHVGALAVLSTGFGALAGSLPNRPARVVAGLVFGAALGGAADAGLMPSAGLTYHPELGARPARRWGLIAAHALFGAVLGALLPGGKVAADDDSPAVIQPEHPVAEEHIALAGGTIIDAQEPAHA